MRQLVHDVTAVRISVVAGAGSCADVALGSQTLALEGEALPAPLAGAGTHPFADALFVLPPGTYRACAQPLAGESPSTACAPTEALVEVHAAATTEVSLTSQCAGDPNGGLDVSVGLNDPPKLDALTLAPSKLITTCESVSLLAKASDPNGDALSYAWAVVAGPDAGRLHANGAAATFSGVAGTYSLTLTVDGGHGAKASFNFPVYVSAATCAVPADVQAIFAARCSPCHITGSSGGLHLDPAEVAFANLVGVASGRCAGRVRVLPGDSAGSYLMAKLRAEPTICGSPMPLNRPALPDAELAAIAGWIDGLPH